MEAGAEEMEASPLIYSKEPPRHRGGRAGSSSNSHSLNTPLSPIDTMSSLSNFEAEIDNDGQGSYSLFPALDNVTSLSVTSDTLESDQTAEMTDKPNLTWLDAAQIILEESGQPMHIKEIKQKVLDRGLVQSNAKSSLEAVMYRETSEERKQASRAGPPQAFLPPQSQAGYSSPGCLDQFAHFPSTSAFPEAKPKIKKGMKKNQNEKYRIKYLKLRKAAKTMIFENAALCDEIARLEEKFVRAKEERRFLLKRFVQLQSVSEGESHATQASGCHLGPAFTVGGSGPVQSSASFLLPGTTSAEDLTSKKSKKDRKDKGKENSKLDVLKRALKKKKVIEGGARKLVQPIPLDPSGRPVFPIVLGGLTVYSLGEIITDRPRFHDQSAIYPVGFCSTRVYASIKNPEQKCLYTCQIKDGGIGPQFEIVPEDDPQNSIVATSAASCHANLLQAISRARGEMLSSVMPSGADFFGFSHPTIQNLIQSCPGARKCVNYHWIRFEVCRPGDGHIPHGLTEDSAAINFEAFQRQVLKEGRSEQAAADEPYSESENEPISPSSKVLCEGESYPSLRIQSPVSLEQTVSRLSQPCLSPHQRILSQQRLSSPSGRPVTSPSHFSSARPPE
ncbi:transforming growth factor beta regulator 1 isoform X2 [Latimeria chalumnae]|uniref:transforming growth factor beta regulator 1 isoform X2 n=1 Tax=Latimeria chalumnae TaxID=7897 RepID=UPI00313E06BE